MQSRNLDVRAHSICLKYSFSFPTVLNVMNAGIKLLGGFYGATDLFEALALIHLGDFIEIYSNSWGPADYGFIVDGPGVLTSLVLELGSREVNSYLAAIN